MAVLAASVTSCTICGTSWCSSTTYNAWPLKRRGMLPHNRHHAAPPGVSCRKILSHKSMGRGSSGASQLWNGRCRSNWNWRYSWIPQTWPQVDLRKKTISISFWGIWCSNKPAWNRRWGSFLQRLLTKNLPDRHSQDLMYASPCLSSKSSGTQDIALWNQPRTSDLGSNNKMDKFG